MTGGGVFQNFGKVGKLFKFCKPQGEGKRKGEGREREKKGVKGEGNVSLPSLYLLFDKFGQNMGLI